MSGGRQPGTAKTGGRKAGVPNKATAEIKALAQEYGPAIIARLATLSGLTDKPGSESEQTQLGCMKELLDRGYGKSPQAITGADGGALHLIVTGVRRALDEAADQTD